MQRLVELFYPLSFYCSKLGLILWTPMKTKSSAHAAFQQHTSYFSKLTRVGKNNRIYPQSSRYILSSYLNQSTLGLILPRAIKVKALFMVTLNSIQFFFITFSCYKLRRVDKIIQNLCRSQLNYFIPFVFIIQLTYFYYSP